MSDQPPKIKITTWGSHACASTSAGSALDAIRHIMDCPKNADRWVIVQWVRDLKEDQAARELQHRKDANRIIELKKEVAALRHVIAWLDLEQEPRPCNDGSDPEFNARYRQAYRDELAALQRRYNVMPGLRNRPPMPKPSSDT